MAEVAGEGDDLETRLLGGQCLQLFERAILRAVIDEHHLPRINQGIPDLNHLAQATRQLRNDLLFVEDGNDDREGGPLHGEGIIQEAESEGRRREAKKRLNAQMAQGLGGSWRLVATLE